MLTDRNLGKLNLIIIGWVSSKMAETMMRLKIQVYLTKWFDESSRLIE